MNDFKFSGESVKRAFENFKKRYQKKKNAWKKSNRSGTSTSATEKFRNAYNIYKFFHWYDDFQRPRTNITNTKREKLIGNKTNFKSILEGINSSSDEDNDGTNNEKDTQEIINNDDGDERDHNNFNDDEDEDDEMDNENDDLKCSEDEILTQTVRPKPVIKPAVNRLSKRAEISMKTDALIGDLAKRIRTRKERVVPPKKINDAEDHFASSLAIEMRKMPEQLRCMAKNEINQVLFKYQMMMFNNPQNLQSNSHGQNYHYALNSFIPDTQKQLQFTPQPLKNITYASNNYQTNPPPVSPVQHQSPANSQDMFPSPSF